jgi:hypothetical protein
MAVKCSPTRLVRTLQEHLIERLFAVKLQYARGGRELESHDHVDPGAELFWRRLRLTTGGDLGRYAQLHYQVRRGQLGKAERGLLSSRRCPAQPRPRFEPKGEPGSVIPSRKLALGQAIGEDDHPPPFGTAGLLRPATPFARQRQHPNEPGHGGFPFEAPRVTPLWRRRGGRA